MQLTIEQRLDALEERLGVSFTNRHLLLEAVTHPSYLNEHRDHPVPDYQVLEFLGDAVLELAVTEHLVQCFRDRKEGGCTKLRSALIRTETLARVGEALQLWPTLLLSSGERKALKPDKRSRRYMLACAVEAIIGAIYRDQGMGECRLFVDAHLLIHLAEIAGAMREWKAELQELVQGRFGPTPTYERRGATGPDHARRYTVAVVVERETLAIGEGASIKEAETEAAQAALTTITTWEGRLVGRGSLDNRPAKRHSRNTEGQS